MEPRPLITSDESADAGPVLRTLRQGELTILGQLVDASNANLLCDISHEGHELRCIYKPRAGERPLWDFPTGTLSRREVAAYVVSDALSWNIVPETVWRSGPFGPGMVQRWIDVDEHVDLVGLVRGTDPLLERISVFDVVINNADRKGGHLLPTAGGAIYGIDHGVTFAVDNKLRTLLWQWEGERIPDALLAELKTLRAAIGSGEVGQQLQEHLASNEISALGRRIDVLLRTRRHPSPAEDRPAIPWPPF